MNGIGVRSRRVRRRAILGMLSLASLGVAAWIHAPGAVLQNPFREDARLEGLAIAELRTAFANAARGLEQDATTALSISQNDPRAFDKLSAIISPTQERGIVLYQGGRPTAWAGRISVAQDSLTPGLSVVIEEFFIALNFTARSGERAAVATALLHAVPPANRISSALEDAVRIRRDVSGFVYGLPRDTTAGEVVVAAMGKPLLRAAAIPLPNSAIQLGRATRARSNAAVFLGFLLVTLLFLAFRDRRQVVERFAALAVAVSAVALVPWNTLSNMAFLFDPAIYFSRVAGPFSASAGATLFISAMVLLAAYTLLRFLRYRLERKIAWLAFPLAAGGLLGARILADGIGQPPWGTTPALWIAWELPLFLVAFTGLVTAFWVLRAAFGGIGFFRLAVGAGLLASAFSIWLVWTNTLEARVRLANQDLAGLAEGDDYTAALLTRFGEELADGLDLGTRSGLLRRYALSDLAAAELPVVMTTWGFDGIRHASLEIADLNPDSAAVKSVVERVIDDGIPIVRRAPGGTGMQFVLGVRSPAGVTSVVVAPQSQLISPAPYSALLGLRSSRGGDAPYTITLADAGALARRPLNDGKWRRIGQDLHTDRMVPVPGGWARAHAEVDLRSFGARAQRAALLTVLNLVVAGILWILVAFAERGFPRWLRVRVVAWAQTYHARLTLALFLFFVVPAISFALWSYRRLAADDRQIRELLVDESLHSAALEPADQRVDTSLRRFAAPILIYVDGKFAGSTEPLLDDLKPLGMFMSPQARRRLAIGEELTASSDERLAGTDVLVGYRAAEGSSGFRYVLASPARRDELVLDRRRRDLGVLVLFATAVGGLAALWLSGVAAKRLARDLELSRIEVARAERVLAWGEMARQIAHEIKNPLTPIRLGVQHLRRARTDTRLDFDRVLDENVERILTEIDRLDNIARTFSRYGTLPADLPPAEPIDVAATLRDVMSLEQLGSSDIRWRLAGAEGELRALARPDELRDVLLNVFENARLAGATDVNVRSEREGKSIHIETIDNGSGISSSVMPRIFEPHFSTRTTGSGLGLAVSRRLIESWGGKIDIANNSGMGTRVFIVLQAAL